ncbi:hypothetical protein FDP22_03025 [Paroceanicella profunda]|uniref:UPF0235 protein FDP22_03025 n=1 Tax=Paroceanicella profunda TaxID=2579971 RepID=A0A5B8FR45_9RHOB|nr:DUF167 family protein [Paroceanicella profunda]QDL90845.1 hypothetical protein FDP22_03025 [Paroceanicella profunda]
MILPWVAQADGLLLTVRLTPRGGRDRIEGVMVQGETVCLRARVATPPVDGEANRALTKLVAKSLGLAPRDVTLVSGETGRIKRLHLAGDAGVLAERLQALV